MKVYCVYIPKTIVDMYYVLHDLDSIHLNRESAEKLVDAFNKEESKKRYSPYLNDPAYIEERTIVEVA